SQIGRINHRYVSPDGIVSITEPLILASDRYGYKEIDTAKINNIGVAAYTDNFEYYLSRGESVPLNSLWACRVNAPSVGIEDPIQSPAILTSYNYPNPFNPSTTIHYSIKEAAKVSVEIYNAKGQRVKMLENAAKAAGDHEIEWNGTDSLGRGVSSGVYLYKIHCGKYSSTKKMMLMK
ncbi:MAG: FlgD immunoglobulin-like domain containing protein, partial [Candidatus Cloacimonetes bacterium]|nr:FlgD immunoglobulin-like domain containing protein [Candidatus Cloacimonadota bacterium]